MAPHIDDFFGYGELDILLKARFALEFRVGKLTVQGKSYVRVGARLAQGDDLSVTSARGGFTRSLDVPTTLPKLRAGRMGACVGG